MTARGRFIVLEGVEGAGKSSAMEHVRATLAAAGVEVELTREPGGTPLGEAIRDVLLSDHGLPMPPMSELLLMFAARAAHLAQRIRPALDAGRWVVCDRFTDASYAYQGAGRGLGEAPVAALERMVQGDLRPDRVFWFDLPVETGLARVRGRGHGNRFDSEDLAFHEKVRGAYRARAEADPDRYVRIDAQAPPEDVQKQLSRALETLL